MLNWLSGICKFFKNKCRPSKKRGVIDIETIAIAQLCIDAYFTDQTVTGDVWDMKEKALRQLREFGHLISIC